MDGRVAYLLWKRLAEAISGILDSVTLQDLADQAQQFAQAAEVQLAAEVQQAAEA